MATRSQIVSPSSSSSLNFPSKLESLTLKETSNSFAPWLDLPVHLTEKFLERLPISDYVRFGAVCPQWRSIQQNHRRRHDRSLPPMLNLPWFVPCEPQPQPQPQRQRQRQQEPVDCFSPFEHRSHRIQLPLSRRYLEGGIENSGLPPRSWHSYEPNGWLVLDDEAPFERFYFTLLNPLSGVQIELPRVGYCIYWEYRLCVSPPPGCFVFLVAHARSGLHFFLFREWDGFWTDLVFSDYNMVCCNSPGEACPIVWEGKVYYMSGWGLVVIDPLPSDPTVEILEMDQSQLPTLRYRWEGDLLHTVEVFMAESNGKLFLVVEFCESGDSYFGSATGSDDRLVVGFQVFVADFSNKRWVRLESLGDRVLFIHKRFVCSLFADDIGVEGNCIYFTDPYKIEESSHQNSSRVGPIPWNVFNLDTGKLTESPLLYAPTSDTLMFVPRLS